MSARAGLCAALLLSVFLLAPLGYPGYFQPQAGFAPIYGLYAWEVGGLRLHPGTPAGPGLLPYALAEVGRLAGMNGPSATKAVFAASALIAAAGAYLLFLRRGTVTNALALSLVSVYTPLSVASIYVRGSPGGALALALLPWLAWSLDTGAPFVVSAAIALAAGLSGLGFALAAVTVIVACLAGAHRLQPRSLLGTGIGLALACAGLVAAATAEPAGAYVVASTPQFAFPYQLLAYNWGYGASSLPWSEPPAAPLTLGVLTVMLALVALVAPRSPDHEPRQAERGSPLPAANVVSRGDRGHFDLGRFLAASWASGALGAIASVVILIFLATPAARWLWTSGTPLLGAGPLAVLLEAPWQLLGLASFLILWRVAPALSALLGERLELTGAVAVLALVLAVPSLDVPTTAVQPSAIPLASFAGGQVTLVSAELEGPLRHGATPRLRLYWQSTGPLERDYTVFVQVLADGDHKWGQQDVQPAGGRRPTSGWRPGELVLDDHLITIDLDGPRQGYRLIVGLYDSETRQPLPLDNGHPYLELRGD